MNLPIIISKAWLRNHYNRSFRWIRKHILTDKVLTKELGYDLKEFANWKDFPPEQGNKLKKWLQLKQFV